MRLLLRWRRGRGWCGGCWLRLGGRRFHALQYGLGTALLDGVDRERDRGQHEYDGGDSGCLGKSSGCTTRTECRLTALSAKGCGNIASFAALQQHNHDQKQANDYVNYRNESHQHGNESPKMFRMSAMVRKGGFEPPRLAAPPPQDGVSASSTTSARVRNLTIRARTDYSRRCLSA